MRLGRGEKRLEEEKGNYQEGVPVINVVVDGGWSKCSHRYSYNAKSGVGIIIGQATGKLLHTGVGTSTEQLAPKESQKISISVTRTGMSPILRWSQISSWKGSNRLKMCMESDTRGLWGIETALCIQL